MRSPLQLPNTFIVGAPNSGAGEMAAYLALHPNVFLCEPSEPYFWCEDYPLLQLRHGMTSLDQYLELFAKAELPHYVRLEASCNYLASEVAVEQIVEAQPDAKFIVMLRDPVELTFEFHTEILVNGFETEDDFETAWRLQAKRRQGESLPRYCEAHQFLQYAEVANYPKQLQRLFSKVQPGNRLVLTFEEFVGNEDYCFHQVLDFLDLGYLEESDFIDNNQERVCSLNTLSSLIHRPILGSAVEAARYFALQIQRCLTGGGSTSRRIRNWPGVRPEFQVELEEFFAEQNRITAEILERDLSGWGTGRRTQFEDRDLMMMVRG